MTFLLEASFLSSYTQADFFGKMIFFGLFTLSIISWVIMIKKIKYANCIKKNSKIFEEIFEEKKEKLLLLKADPAFEEHNPFFSIYLAVKQKTLVNGRMAERSNYYNFFDTYYNTESKLYLGEDFNFCKLWTDIGGKIYALADEEISHVGEKLYRGKLLQEFIKTTPAPLPAEKLEKKSS